MYNSSTEPVNTATVVLRIWDLALGYPDLWIELHASACLILRLGVLDAVWVEHDHFLSLIAVCCQKLYLMTSRVDSFHCLHLHSSRGKKCGQFITHVYLAESPPILLYERK